MADKNPTHCECDGELIPMLGNWFCSKCNYHISVEEKNKKNDN